MSLLECARQVCSLHPSYSWTNLTYPIEFTGLNHSTYDSWGEPPSIVGWVEFCEVRGPIFDGLKGNLIPSQFLTTSRSQHGAYRG